MSDAVPFRDALRVWIRVAALSFGGPAGQIAVMHRILVEEKRWIGETRFLHALNYCMLLPGPEAHQLAVYIGWLMHRMKGGLVAGTLFILPGLVSLGILSWIYASYGEIGWVAALFFGLKTAVLAVVLHAVFRVGRRALRTSGHFVIATLAFAGLFLFQVPFPLLIAAAALIGFAGHALGMPSLAPSAAAHGAGRRDDLALIDAEFAKRTPEHVKPSLRRFLKIAIVGLTLWLAPLVLLYQFAGAGNAFTTIAAFNSKMALVTFGGAYAALSYMAQQAVENYHWLQPDEMLVGLGFAETTPGPLISVVQFVGFMAGFRAPGALDPALAGTLGGVLAMWATFVPSFLWIFLGAPYVEALLGYRPLEAALSAITAAVVGVILNLAVWFAAHTLFAESAEVQTLGMRLSVPNLASLDIAAALLSAGAIIAMFGFRVGMLPVFAASSALGVALYLAGVA